jgi:hypothetical protein
MRRRKSRLALILALTLGLSVAVPAAAQARTLYATTSHGQLLSFPDRATKVKGHKKGHKKSKKYVRAKIKRTVTGLPSGVRLVGIDFRPTTGELFAIGSNSVVYRVLLNDRTVARGLPVGNPFAPALAGTSFGVDFNPVPDAIRIVSDAGQNLRITMPNTPIGNMDGALNPGSPSIVGAGYSNSGFSDTPPAAGTTTLFTIDAAANTLNTQGSPGGTPVSPNTGTHFPIGSLGIDVGTTLGFDVVGPFASPSGYLTNVDGRNRSTLYRVDLARGQTHKVGQVVTVSKRGKARRTVLTGLAAVQD